MTPDRRLEDLFARYWDGALSPEEFSELEAILRTDSEACERFQLCIVVAMTAGETIDSTPVPDSPIAIRPVPVPVPSVSLNVGRRRLIKFAGVGLAAGVAGTVVGWLARRPETHAGFRLVSLTGTVALSDDRKAGVGALVSPGTTISTAGTDSSVTLAFDEQSTITLPGDTSVSIGRDGRHLTLARGHVAADIRAVADRATSLTVATDHAAFRISALADSREVTAAVIGRQGQLTDLAVERGRVLVNHPISGDQLAEANLGDYLTVQSNGGKITKEPGRATPDRFVLDLTAPLPKRWETGYRDDGSVLRPEWWYDPYHDAEQWQIRSHNEWTRGFARLHPDSLVRVKYRVARPGKSQVCLCVRTPHSTPKHRTGVLDSVTAFENARPNDWQWFEVRADKMLDHKESPGFEAPWIAFLIIVNTYERDLGLEIAAFEIIRPDPSGRL